MPTSAHLVKLASIQELAEKELRSFLTLFLKTLEKDLLRAGVNPSTNDLISQFYKDIPSSKYSILEELAHIAYDQDLDEEIENTAAWIILCTPIEA